jgi:hypothetical protein
LLFISLPLTKIFEVTLHCDWPQVRNVNILPMDHQFSDIISRLSRIEAALASKHPAFGYLEPDHYLNVNDVANMLHITPQSIYRLVMLRKIPHRKVNKKLFFTRKEIIAYIENNKRSTVE